MMTNLENITEKIIADARIKAEEIISEARQKEEQLFREKKNQALREKEKMIEKAKKDALLKKERMISRAQLQARDEKLAAKQEIIEKVFQLVKEKLQSLPNDQYIAFLQQQLADRKWHGREILLVPEKYIDDVDALGLPVQVMSDESVPSGFIIKDGNIVNNYSFDALVDFYRDELEPVIARELFAGLE